MAPGAVMGFRPGEEHQSSNIRKAIEEAGLDMGAVWIAYFTMGGNAGTWEVEAYIGGALSLPALERDILAQAINELIDELPPRRKATFSDDGADIDHGRMNSILGRALMPPPSRDDGPGSSTDTGAGGGSAAEGPPEPEDGDGEDRRESAGRGGYGNRQGDEETDGDTRQRYSGDGGDE